MHDISHIKSFLLCETPNAWISEALKPSNLAILLIDHANCELKAAQTAQGLMWKYRSGPMSNLGVNAKNDTLATNSLLTKLSQLAREELLHFEQVFEFMSELDISYLNVSASRYAKELRQEICLNEPGRLVDTLIVGAIIEARSCERFAAIAPFLMKEKKTEALGRYYLFLLKSESRHYEDYLSLASLYSREGIQPRVSVLLEKEKQLVESVDVEFRFHSGRPL